MKNDFDLTNEGYIKSIEFALKLWYSGKSKGDWRSTGTTRSLGQYITDHAEGKLAEKAFALFLKENFNIDAVLDFDVHEGASATDAGDVNLIKTGSQNIRPGLKLDVKSTKPNSLWAVVDAKEFNSRAYDAYIWVKVALPLNHLAPLIFKALCNRNLEDIRSKLPQLDKITAQIVGFAWRSEVECWEVKQRGSTICDPTTPKKRLFTAKTTNKLAPLTKLKNKDLDWDELRNRLINN